MNDKPLGGTELMYNELMKRLDKELRDKFSIFNYPAYADLTKQTIYWNQLSYDQQAVQFLLDPNQIEKIDQFVFVSNWQAEQFRKVYGIPGIKTKVIPNACIGVSERSSGIRDKVRLCYTSTPWRGLDVLLMAWEALNLQDVELHIFSSTKIYGRDFAINNENYYQDLYDKCKELPNVVYRGSVSNKELRGELSTFDILAYPNTFEETSCISVIEALSAGLRVVTSSLGALPETTEGWARMYSFIHNKERHAAKFAHILGEEIAKIRAGQLDDHLELQKKVYSPRWSWDQRIKEWTNYLNTLTPREQLISEPTQEGSQKSSATDIQHVGL